MINQPEKMTENCISLINAGIDKTAGQMQYRQFLNKGQRRLIEKLRYPEKPLRTRAETYKKPNPHLRSFLRFKPRPQWWEPLHRPCYQNESWMLFSAFSEIFFSSNKG